MPRSHKEIEISRIRWYS